MNSGKSKSRPRRREGGRLRAEHEEKERSKGMSAAKAKRSGIAKPTGNGISEKPGAVAEKTSTNPVAVHHLVIDGRW